MKYSLFTISISSLLLATGYVFAGDEPPTACDNKEYTCYEEHVKNFCEDKKLPWNDGQDLGALKSLKIGYSEASSGKVNETIKKIQELEQSDPTILNDGISLSSMGGNESFRLVELARLMYRKNMNSIFACGVIASRSAKLDALYGILNGKQKVSEIQKSVEKERKRYETLKKDMNCDNNRPEKSSTGVTERVMKSSMKEYCRYSYYLDYVDANLRENFSKISELNTQVGEGNTSKPAYNTDTAQRELSSRGQAINDERTRANDVLPKAIIAFQEMDRTYIIHVMLTFIYDDYMRLRNQLNTYLTTIGQTFEKAKGAQDANNK